MREHVYRRCKHFHCALGRYTDVTDSTNIAIAMVGELLFELANIREVRDVLCMVPLNSLVVPGGEDCIGPPLDDDAVVRFCDEVFLLAIPLELVSSVNMVSSVRLSGRISAMLKFAVTSSSPRHLFLAEG